MAYIADTTITRIDMPIEKHDFALYILMRKDMESLRHAGKMIAQGAHAANHAAAAIGQNRFGSSAMSRFAAWEKSTEQAFGTTIIYGGIVDRREQRALRIDDIRLIVECAKAAGHPAGIVTDPTYPLNDGEVVHGFPCDTCGWLFMSRAEAGFFLRNLTLHSASA